MIITYIIQFMANKNFHYSSLSRKTLVCFPTFVMVIFGIRRRELDRRATSKAIKLLFNGYLAINTDEHGRCPLKFGNCIISNSDASKITR